MIEMVSGLAAAIRASLSTQLPPPPTSSAGNFLSDLETRNHSIIQVHLNVIITESHISKKRKFLIKGQIKGIMEILKHSLIPKSTALQHVMNAKVSQRRF